MRRSSGDGFFGRDAELAELREASAATFRDGRVSVAVVEGDPGAGKSRLLAEFLAELPPAATVTATCYQPEARLPLSLARSLLRELAPAGRDRGGSGAEAGEGGPAADAGPSALAEAGVSALAEAGPSALAEALHRALSLRAPAAVVVDDVQWCDDESVGLLHYLLRGAAGESDPLFLLLAGRPSPTLARLSRAVEALLGRTLVRVPVGPLGDAAAVALIRSLDPRIDPATAGDLAARASGLPFWCRLLADSADPARPAGEVITARMRSLSTDATATLTTCVVLARPIDVHDLAEIHGWPEVRVQRSVAELSGVGFVVEESGAVRLVHDLVRAAVEDLLPATERTRELVAGWLERRAGADVPQLLAAAQHRRAVGLATTTTLQRILSAPMRRMLGLDGLQTVLELVDELPVDDPRTVGLVRDLAALAGELGRHSLALERWSWVAGRLEDPADRARAWTAASEAAQHLERPDEARRHLRAARRLAPDDDPLLAIELDTTEAGLVRWLEHDLDRAQELTDRALVHARALVDEPAEPAVRDAYLRALVLACLDAMQRNATEDLLGLADELSDVAAGADTRSSATARLRGGSALMLAGQLAAADRELSHAWGDARRAFLTDLVLDVGSWLVWTRYLRGRLLEAEEVAIECGALSDRLAEPTRPAHLVELWRRTIEISRGDHQAALDALRRMAEAETDDHHRVAPRRALAVWLARLDPQGAADEVRGQLAAARSDVEAAGCVRCRTELLLSGAEALARVGDVDAGEAWLDEGRASGDGGALQRWAALRAEAALATARAEAALATARAEAGLTTAHDDDPAAPALLERTAALSDELDLGLEAVWARLDLGRLLVESDPERAAEVLMQARAGAEAAGAVTEGRLAASLLRRTGVRTWHRPEPADADPSLAGLSPREREIAAMVADGASNPEIAQALFLSRKTIERHVSSIFLKTGVKNRTQLAALVVSPPPD